MNRPLTLVERMRAAEVLARQCAGNPGLGVCRRYRPRPSVRPAEQELGLDVQPAIPGPPGPFEWLQAIADADLPGLCTVEEGPEGPFLVPV